MLGMNAEMIDDTYLSVIYSRQHLSARFLFIGHWPRRKNERAA